MLILIWNSSCCLWKMAIICFCSVFHCQKAQSYDQNWLKAGVHGAAGIIQKKVILSHLKNPFTLLQILNVAVFLQYRRVISCIMRPQHHFFKCQRKLNVTDLKKLHKINVSIQFIFKFCASNFQKFYKIEGSIYSKFKLMLRRNHKVMVTLHSHSLYLSYLKAEVQVVAQNWKYAV